MRNLLSTVGKGLLSGQWGSAKTLIALDLSGCVMTGEEIDARILEEYRVIAAEHGSLMDGVRYYANSGVPELERLAAMIEADLPFLKERLGMA